MEMESSLTPPPPPPKFRFRDNSEPESQNSSELGSDVVSAMSPSIRHPDADLEIESMTGRVLSIISNFFSVYFHLINVCNKEKESVVNIPRIHLCFSVKKKRN